jgi:class 3 adenylate cyclase
MQVSTEKTTLIELPTGEITLLFTDVVGSSRLWEEHGDGFIPIWQAHDAVLRDAFSRFGGYEVKTEGDAFMVAFKDPAAAVHCALFAQAALSKYPWPADIGPIRVRMGMHTGEPIVHGNDYFGPVVNKAANICKAAHGGQILISEDTAARSRPGLDAKVHLDDLGDHRLRDMGPAQRMFEAGHTDYNPRAFPHPRSLEPQPNNLPIQRTSFVGRAQEIEQIAAYLAQGNKPMLTVTGPSGVGKTRLSLQAAAVHADWFPDGVWYVKMDRAGDLKSAAEAIAAAIKIPMPTSPEADAVNVVREWVAGRRCLLILDDANNLPHADRLLRELLAGSDGLRCLATARESLQIAGAETIELSGLSTADAEANVGPDLRPEEVKSQDIRINSDAGRLFMDRAAEANPDFKITPVETAAVVRLIHWLEGVPESIEKAAALMDKLSPATVVDELEKRVMPVLNSAAGPGVEKLKEMMRASAQKVKVSTSDTVSRPPSANISNLIQGIATVEADKKNEEHAAALSRESLRAALEAGDEVAMADSMRQLAAMRARHGDHQSASALLAAASQLYRRNAPQATYSADGASDNSREAAEAAVTAALELAMKQA